MIETLGEIHKKLGGLSSKVIHVAGSKGKGTVCYILAEALKNKGFKVGLFSSPALFCYEEMIQINSMQISTTKLYGLIEEVKKAAGNFEASMFEQVTLAALLYFEQEKCDYVLLEVGMGGRLDATNIVDKKDLTILTHMEMEHFPILGDNLYDITKEKLGICRKGVPLITSIDQNPDVFKAIEDMGFEAIKTGSFELGYHNADSIGIAFGTLDILGIQLSPSEIERIKELKIPGRFEIRKVGVHTLIMDGAHTYDSIQNLHRQVSEFIEHNGLPDPIWAIHILKDKPRDLVNLFLPLNSIWINLRDERAAEAPSDIAVAEPEEFLRNLKNDSEPKTVVFGGSFRLVAKVKELLGDKPAEGFFV